MDLAKGKENARIPIINVIVDDREETHVEPLAAGCNKVRNGVEAMCNSSGGGMSHSEGKQRSNQKFHVTFRRIRVAHRIDTLGGCLALFHYRKSLA